MTREECGNSKKNRDEDNFFLPKKYKMKRCVI